MDLRNGAIRMINTSNKTLEDILKTHKYKQKSKTQDGRSSDEDTRRIGTNLCYAAASDLKGPRMSTRGGE